LHAIRYLPILDPLLRLEPGAEAGSSHVVSSIARFCEPARLNLARLPATAEILFNSLSPLPLR
jgi:hypothetical protein